MQSGIHIRYIFTLSHRPMVPPKSMQIHLPVSLILQYNPTLEVCVTVPLMWSVGQWITYHRLSLFPHSTTCLNYSPFSTGPGLTSPSYLRMVWPSPHSVSRSLRNGRYCTVYYMVQYSNVQYIIWCSTVRYSILQYIIWYSTMQYSIVQYMVQHSTEQHSMVQYCMYSCTTVCRVNVRSCSIQKMKTDSFPFHFHNKKTAAL